MISVLPRKNLLFLSLGVFVLLFGIASDAFAVNCADITSGWKINDFPCEINFQDTGGSGLKTCEYRVVGQSVIPSWTPASCSGDGPVVVPITVTVGATQSCQFLGNNACWIQMQVEDNSGQTNSNSYFYSIDYIAPTLAQVTAVPSYTSDTTPDYTFSSTENGTITYGGDCSSVTTTASTGNNTVTFNTLTQGVHSNCIIRVSDVAGNQSAPLNVNAFTIDMTAPTIVNVSSNKANGNYTVGEIIDIDVTFSEAVSSTGNVTVTLETGTTDRTCAFTVLAVNTGTCNYTVQVGDTSADLTVALISGTIKDAAMNTMTNFVPTTNLAANKAIVIDTIASTVTTFSINGTSCIGGGCPAVVTTNVALNNIVWTASDNTGGSNLNHIEVWRAPDSGGSPGSWARIINNAISPVSDNPVDGIYWYGIYVIDNALNCITEAGAHCGGAVSDSYDIAPLGPRTIRGPIKVVMDKTAPTVNKFNVTPKDPAWVNGTSPTDKTSISWTVSDTTNGSNLKQIEVWRAFDNPPKNNAPDLAEWAEIVAARKTSGFTSANTDAGSYIDTGLATDGTYWYGLHIKDNALNCITEDTDNLDGKKGHCGGVTSDSLDNPPNTSGRQDKGPIKVIVDKNVPPKPTCSPAGGIFQNSVNVTCSDAEASATTRYTLDGSSPTISSTLYSAPFNVINTSTLAVAAWDIANNQSATPNNSYSFTITHNQAPSVSSVSDSPDPIKADASINFSVNWNDPDADLTKIHICKTNAISGQTCSEGSWCDTTTFSSTSPTSCGGTSPASSGSQSYYVFACDNGACSASVPGTFLVDAIAPIVPSAPDLVTASDTGVLGTDNKTSDTTPTFTGTEVENGSTITLYRNGVAQSPTGIVSGGVWTITLNIQSAGINNYTATAKDAVGNESSSSSALSVTIDSDKPTSQIQSPAGGSFQGNNFSITVADLDTGGSGLDTIQCTYSVSKLVDGAYQQVFSDTSRTCGAVTPTIRTLDQCSAEGINACRVIVKSKDIAGNLNVISQSANSLRDFSIDLTWPVVDKVSCGADLGVPCANVQQGVATTFRAAVSDNLQLANCEFLWRPTGGVSWQNMADPGFNTIACQGAHTGNCLETFTGHTFNTVGTYDVRSQCWDSAFHTMPGDFVSVAVQTLSVIMSATPPSGSINTFFDLVGTVSGTITGDINYKFDCTNDGTWDWEIDNQVQNPYTAVDLCQYTSLGTYTAKVFVQRGAGVAQDTVDISVSANSIPTPINRSVDPANATDYCGVVGYPPVRVRWAFSDADPGDTQGAYQIQVFQGGTKVVDTGKKSGATQEYVFQSAGEQLVWSTTYTWQVKVWDNPSDTPSAFVAGPQFTTSQHYYPIPNFVWSPAFPGAEELVQFTDQTNFAGGATGKTWSWTFGDGGSSSLQNPTHIYLQTNPFNITLQATDNVGSCSNSQTVNVSVPFPEWQEISPF